MPARGFDDFVKRQQGKAEDLKTFWGRERDEFISAVREVYQRIEGYIHNYVVSKGVFIDYYDLEINETDTGNYTVQKCTIRIGHKSVILEPVGTQLIGTKGRIDVTGGAGRGRLMLINTSAPARKLQMSVMMDSKADRMGNSRVDHPTHWAWKIVTFPPHVNFIELNEENFLNLLMEVAGG